MIAAICSKYNLPYVRFALNACRCHTMGNDGVEDIVTKSSPLCGALLSMIPSEDASVDELERLFAALCAVFATKPSFTVNIDYGIQPSEFSNVYYDWCKACNEARDTQGRAHLAVGALGFKTWFGYDADGKCFSGERIINHQGVALAENPWETYFKVESEATLQLARELDPTTPPKWAKKLASRAIVRVMGYTPRKDALSSLMHDNYGVTEYLLQLEPCTWMDAPIAENFLRQCQCREQWDILTIVVESIDKQVLEKLCCCFSFGDVLQRMLDNVSTGIRVMERFTTLLLKRFNANDIAQLHLDNVCLRGRLEWVATLVCTTTHYFPDELFSNLCIFTQQPRNSLVQATVKRMKDRNLEFVKHSNIPRNFGLAE